MVYIHVCIFYIYMYINIYIYKNVYVCFNVCVCVFVYVGVYMYVCMCVINTYINSTNSYTFVSFIYNFKNIYIINLCIDISE